MKRTFAMALFLFAVGCGIGYASSGCRPSALPAYCTNEVAFTAALVRCVDKSPTLVESRACRADVHARCGITLTSSARSEVP